MLLWQFHVLKQILGKARCSREGDQPERDFLPWGYHEQRKCVEAISLANASSVSKLILDMFTFSICNFVCFFCYISVSISPRMLSTVPSRVTTSRATTSFRIARLRRPCLSLSRLERRKMTRRMRWTPCHSSRWPRSARWLKEARLRPTRLFITIAMKTRWTWATSLARSMAPAKLSTSATRLSRWASRAKDRRWATTHPRAVARAKDRLTATDRSVCLASWLPSQSQLFGVFTFPLTRTT